MRSRVRRYDVCRETVKGVCARCLSFKSRSGDGFASRDYSLRADTRWDVKKLG